MVEPIEIHDYDELISAIRRVVAVSHRSHETINTLAGLPDRYINKLLCDPPIRGIGAGTLGPILQAIGRKLVLIEDPVTSARLMAEPQRVEDKAKHGSARWNHRKRNRNNERRAPPLINTAPPA